MGLLGLIVGLSLGLLGGRHLPSRGSPAHLFSPNSGLRQWVTARRVRAEVPALVLDLDFPAYQQLITPPLDQDQTTEPVCVVAEATYRDTPGAVSLCQSRAITLAAPSSGNVPLRPVLELQGESGGVPVFDGRRNLLTPAGSDAAAATGYLAALDDLGIPVPAYEIVSLTVNGSNWGPYAVEERWPIEPFPADPAAHHRVGVAFDGTGVGVVDDLGSGFARAEMAVGYLSGFPDNGAVLAMADDVEPLQVATEAARRFRDVLMGYRAPSAVLDAQKMGRTMALTALWRGCFVPDWRAMAFAYDVAADTFVPVGSGLPHVADRPIPIQLYDDPSVQRALAEALWAFSDPGYLDAVLAAQELEALAEAIGGQVSGQVGLRETLAQRQVEMRRAVTPRQTLRAWYGDTTGALRLEIEPTQPFPVEIVGLQLGEEGFVPSERAWVPPEEQRRLVDDSGIVLPARVTDLPVIVSLLVPRTSLPSTTTGDGVELHVVTRIWGLPERVPVPVRVQSPYAVAGGR